MADTPPNVVDPDACVLDRERRTAVARALRALPLTERRVVRRLFGIGATAANGEKGLDEVAADLGLSSTGVWKARERAFEKLRAKFTNRRRELL